MCVVYRFLFFLFIFSNTHAFWYFNTQDVNALHSGSVNQTLFYGKDPLQFVDVRLPVGKGPFPVAIILHGGCWLSHVATLRNTAALAEALREEGIATFNVEYRGVDKPGGGWPGTFLDVAHGADYILSTAKKDQLDLSRVIVIGHSAGGQLALWLAARNKLLPNSDLYSPSGLQIKGVVVLGGVPNLKELRKQVQRGCDGVDVVGKLIDGSSSAQVESRYAQASPSELLPIGVPQILIYGTDDQIIPPKYGYSYMTLAKRKGDYVKLIIVQHAGHHEYIVPNAITWNAVKSSVLTLLK